MKVIDPRQEWRTPDSFWKVVNAEFDFQLDAAASPHNARCKKFYTAEQDSLSDKCPWITDDVRRVWINPGFSNIGPWCKKAAEEVIKRPESVVVILSLISPSTDWWMKHVHEVAAEVRLIGGKRIQFEPEGDVKKSSNARENCLIIYMGYHCDPLITTWDWTDSYT